MSKRGRRTPARGTAFKRYVNELTKVDWFVGTDLRRLMELPGGTAVHKQFLVRRLENSEAAGRCDACIKRHSPTNARCGMNIAGTRAYDSCFYDFRTRRPIPGRWQLLDCSWQRGSIGTETWQRVAKLAGTRTGGELLWGDRL